MGLCVAQCKVESACLQHFVGMSWRKTQCQTSVNDVFTESYGNFCHSVLGHLVVDGVIVERAAHSCKRWVVVSVVLRASHLLYDYSHLFLVDKIACGGHVCFAVGIEH